MALTAMCEVCGNSFGPKPGTTGRFCSVRCYQRAGPARRLKRERPTSRCEQCGTEFVPRPAGAGRFCSHACYAASIRGVRKPNVSYRMRTAREHPVAPPCGIVATSRITLYDKIGGGEHPCHWCGRTLRWRVGEPHTPDALFADHLDHDPTNDAAANLVPTCHVCNAHRTRLGDKRLILEGEPTLLMNGTRTRAIERACEYCGDPFLALPAAVRQGKGRFCSRSCARRAPRRAV